MEQFISAEYIQNQINPVYSPFFLINSSNLNIGFKPVINSFLEAIELFAPNINFNKTVQIIIGSSVFDVRLSNSTLKLEVKPEVVNLYVESMIFIDVCKMLNYGREQQIVAVLEEFVHAFMNVKNEELAAKIVCDIYGKASYCNGHYLFNS